MPRRRHVIDGADLDRALDVLLGELDVPGPFPPAVLVHAEAVASAAAPLADPDRRDRRDLGFATVDPPGSMDLDQAFCIEPGPAGGWIVWYAIADVAAFVAAGDPVDAEARRRGVTRYAPGRRAPLHPPAISEGAASLLPGVDRPAVLWRLVLDDVGELVETGVERAVVRSRARLTYDEAQVAVEAGEPGLAPLRAVGELRLAREAARGGVSLPVPDQVVERDGAGAAELRFRAPLPAEAWNAQLSLLCGIAAARLQLAGGAGLLRTLPAAAPVDVERLRRHAAALGVAWPPAQPYAEFVRALDTRLPDHAALAVQAARLFRGASYLVVEPGLRGDDPAVRHAAVAAPYAHVTAPLRRLADRFATEAAMAACAGRAVPGWVTDALPLLPDLMRTSGAAAAALERGVVDLVEAIVLGAHVGEVFDGVVVDERKDGSVVQLRSPAVVATVPDLPAGLGDEVALRVVSADPVTRRTVLAPA